MQLPPRVELSRTGKWSHWRWEAGGRTEQLCWEAVCTGQDWTGGHGWEHGVGRSVQGSAPCGEQQVESLARHSVDRPYFADP